MKYIDLNCDLGESFGAYNIGQDEKVLPFISSANIACGYHAGDPVVMSKTVELAVKNNVKIGAHPGFPDLVGFGRRNMQVSFEEAKAYVKYQIGALNAFCIAKGVKLHHVKPHGALYNMAAKDEILAEAICEGILEVDSNLILLALSGSKMCEVAENLGLKYASEVFADRAYMADGSLCPRSHPDSMITDEDVAISRVIRMVKEGVVATVDGNDIPIQAESVCVHGDGEKALAFVQKINKSLIDADIQIVDLKKVINKRVLESIERKQ